MQISSSFIFGLFYILIDINLSCTHAKKTRLKTSREDHDVRDERVIQDIDVRAILIRCPQENANEVFHSNPKSISNISALRTEAILQFPGYDSDEATFQSNVVKCRRKIVIYLKIRKTGKIPTEDKFIVVNHVFDQLTGKKARLLNAYVLKIKQEPSYEMYPLKFTNVVNGEATEEVISKSSSNYTGCDDKSDNPTCGIAYHKGMRVPYSQGFCCSCDASVNAERQPGCHRGDVDGGGWKPDASFRQTGKAFESSDTISASKINKVKENALAGHGGVDGEPPKNDSCSHLNVDEKKDNAAISLKSSAKARGNAKGKHHSDTKSRKSMKSTTCEKRKWRTSTDHASEVSMTTSACTKQPAKKSSLNSNSTCSTASTSALESLSPGLENLSADAQSDATSAAGDRGSVPPSATTPSNFVVTAAEETSLKTTDIWLASEMYRVSSRVTKEKSANTISTESPSTVRSSDQLASGNSAVEGNRVHFTTETKKKTHHAGNLPCTDKPSSSKQKKYHHHIPSPDQPVDVIGALKMAKQGLDNLSHTTKQTPEKCKSSIPKNKPQSDMGAEDAMVKTASNTTECPKKGKVSKATSISSETKHTTLSDTLIGETSTARDSSIKNSETPTKLPILNDFPSAATSEDASNFGQTTKKESCTSPSSLPTNAKWTDDKFNEGDTDTGSKFAASSLLELPGLDLKVNNLHNDEQFEFSTENVADSISVDGDGADVLTAVKGDIGGGGYLQSGGIADDSAEETGFQKKEIIAKDIKSILAESKTESLPLESLGDVELDKANEVSPSSSDPLAKETKLSGRLSQDEINDIILASNQELEIEPHMSRKRRKEDEGRESSEGDTNESDGGSSNSTRTLSCPLDSTSSAKNDIKHSTTQKHSPTKMHAASKKHDKFHWLFKQKTASQHGNCTKYPTGSCLSECRESTTEAFKSKETEKSAAESIKRQSEVAASKTSKAPSRVRHGDQIESDTNSVLASAKEMKGNDEFSSPSIDSAVHANVHGRASGAGAFASEKEAHFPSANIVDSFEENEKSGPNITNSRLQFSPEKLAELLSQQVDFAETREKHVKSDEGGANFPNDLGGNDDEAINDADSSLPLEHLSKTPRYEADLEPGVNDFSLRDSREEDGLIRIRDDDESTLRRTVDSDVDVFGRKTKRFPTTRLDYFNELERQRLEDKFHAGKAGKVKREAIYETRADATSLDSAISGEQQVKPAAIRDDEATKTDAETKGVVPDGKTVNADDASIEPLTMNFAHRRENSSSAITEQDSSSLQAGEVAAKLKQKNVSTMKPVKTTSAYETSTISSRSTDKAAAESEGKAIKNCKECIRINPLSKMPSIAAKLNSLNRASNTSACKPLPISPSSARAKSRPNTEPPPGSAEEKLNALLKDLQRKLLPLIEDAEDKKVIAAEEEADRLKKKNRVPSCKKHKRRPNRNVDENRERRFETHVKRSDGNLNKRSKRRTDPVKRRQYPVGSKQTPRVDEGASSEEDTVGYEPHYITDQVPSEKARVLDLKGGAQHKDKEKCAPAVLNTKSSQTSGANHFTDDDDDDDSRSKEYKGVDDSDGRAYLELLAAIAADSLRERSYDEKPPIDGVNVGIDTPICESSCNLLANDYASFVDDEEDEEDDDESESFHCETETGKKSVVSEDSLSFFPVGSNENDYLDVVDTEEDVRVNEEKEFRENRSKRNPHGGARKNHLKITMPSEEYKLAKNCNENKESSEKRQYDGADADPDYITLRFDVDDEHGVSREGEDDDDDDDAHLARQKRQVLAGGHQVRGGQNCVDRSTPANVNPKTYHESAHCLRFSDLWYAVYKLNEPEIVRTIYVQIYEKRTAEDGSAQWVDHTHGKMIGLGTNNPKPLDFLPALSLEFHSEDDCPVPFALNASSCRLLIPQPVCKEKTSLYPQLQGGPGEYLVLDKSLVASDADACDVAGVAFEGFARQDDRCGRPRGSCLRNQPVQFWRADIEARMAGREGHYLLENFADVPEKPIKTDKDGEQFLALEFDETQESFVAIELEADSNTIVRVGTSVQITEIHSDSTTPGMSDLTVVVTNTGLASSRYLARVADCPMDAPKEWTAVETPLHDVAPQRDVRMQLRLLGEMMVESMHCSVEVLNAARELVATRRFRLQLNDRCFCVWWCLCACIGTVDGLKCRPQSQHHHHAGGFEGGVPITEPPGAFHLASAASLTELSGDWFALFTVVFLVVLATALLLGLTKAIIGVTCSPAVGAWGLFLMAFKPHRIQEYYEDDLRDMEVVYDRQGYPVHPHTGHHSVRANTEARQFLRNLPFFVLILPAILCRMLWYNCWQASKETDLVQCPTGEFVDFQEKGCNDNMCFDSYDDNDARDDAAMNYVANEMNENQPAVVASFVDVQHGQSCERACLLPSSASSRRKKHSKRAPTRACRMAARMLQQEFTYRFFMTTHGDVDFPNNIPYCIKGHLSWDGKAYVWEPITPLEQNWTFNGDLILMDPPRRLDPRKFVIRYRTAQEMYDDRAVSDRVVGFCINVVLKDDTPLPM